MATALPFKGLTGKKLRGLQNQAKTKREFQRVQCLYLRQSGCASKDIATVMAMSPVGVRRVWVDYRKEGEKSVFREKRGGRYRENMTEAEEDALLKPFFRDAQKGGVLLVNDIQKVYEEKIGRRVQKSTIYAVLHRHGWRKIAPRPSHPKGNSSQKEIFKASFPPQGENRRHRS